MRKRARPFISASIAEIETALDAALMEDDKATVGAIAHELTYRRVPRARTLAERLKSGPRQAAASPSERKRGPSAGKASASVSEKPGYRPTGEQQAAIEAFETLGSLRINAFAGSGKTSTLQMLAHRTGRRGQYIAFNKAIVADAKGKFPKTVACSTSHGLAFRSTPTTFRQSSEKMTGKVNAQKLADILGIEKHWRIDRTHVLQARSQAYLILSTVRRFAQSGDDQILERHVPRYGALLNTPDEVVAQVSEFAKRGAEHIWARMCDPNDDLPLGHDGYLKLWALSQPQIAADFILLDEAQDTNPVVLEVLRKQEAQLVYVGDRHQQIYEWRGAVNAMAAMPSDHSVELTQSFRFGPEIAAAATRVLARLGEPKPLIGNGEVRSLVGSCRPDTVLARTNGNVMAALVTALNNGRRPHLVGGPNEFMTLLRGVQDLKAGSPSAVPEFFGFQNWQEVVAFAETQEGQHLLTFVNLVQSRGEKQLMWALNRTVDEDKADLVLSTAHKAKGREWDNVELMDDFLATRPGNVDDRAKAEADFAAELRLFYVALTRARKAVSIPEPIAAKLGIVVSEQGRPSESRQSYEKATPTKDSIALPNGQTVPAWSPPSDWSPPPTSPASTPRAQPRQVYFPHAATNQARKAKRGLFDWLFGTR